MLEHKHIGMRSRKIYKRDVFMHTGCHMAIQRNRRYQISECRFVNEKSFLSFPDLDSKTDLFLHFSECRLNRIFAELDMPSDAQPYAVFVVAAQQHLVVVYDKHLGRKIYFFVNVCHIRPLGLEPRTPEV